MQKLQIYKYLNELSVFLIHDMIETINIKLMLKIGCRVRHKITKIFFKEIAKIIPKIER